MRARAAACIASVAVDPAADVAMTGALNGLFYYAREGQAIRLLPSVRTGDPLRSCLAA